MSLKNSNFQEKQGNIKSNEQSEIIYKKSQASQRDSSGRNNKHKKNSILKEQTPSQFQSKGENQIKEEIQVQENVANQSNLSKRDQNKSLSQEKKYETQPKLNQIEKNEEQVEKQVQKNSQLKIQPAFSVNIQITQYNNNSKTIQKFVSPQIRDQKEENKINEQQNELQPIQLVQSNIFQSQNKESGNRRSSNQERIQEFNRESLDNNFNERKLSSYEIKMGVTDDPMLKEKQEILSDIHEILKQIQVKSLHKRHSILEDCLQLCLLLLPDIRITEDQIHSLKFFEDIKLQYNLDRTHQAFKRRFYHLQIFSNCWTVQNLQKMYQIIKNSQDNQLEAYHINYSIVNKTIEFPELVSKKKSPEKPKAVQEIIANSQNKKIVLSLTTKTLCQYVNLPAKEIDEDIQEFEDELQFVEMILKLIPLAL
ncbi:unnamed protein product [Paramecium sonneborni]|uniref:Uncharacterized protein n=1 Tax=Paramecium sonneborni TaxID=65129 RepID=A0A8S1QU29_9CILI|nr:unnamed protein product [Paramecium sonneborni]